MNRLKFLTTSGRIKEVAFCEDVFLNWMELCGKANLDVKEQIQLFLELMYGSVLAKDEHIKSIGYDVSGSLLREYEILNDAKKYIL